MITWEATVKEVGNDHLLHPSWTCADIQSYDDDFMRKFLIGFWGLDKPDVEWYTLKKIEDLTNK